VGWVSGPVTDLAAQEALSDLTTKVPVLAPEDYGWIAVEDGGSPVTAEQLDAILDDFVANRGARIQGGPGKTYRCDLQINIPHDGAAPPKQYPFILAGFGVNKTGQGTALHGGTVFDLRYAGSNRSSGTNPDGTSVNYNDAKIVGIGLGLIDFDGVTLTDKGTSSAPFLHTTYTTVKTTNLAVVGNPSKTLTTCDQDFWIAGGQTVTPGTPTGSGVDEPFQGYGSVISNVYCNRIRRLVLGQVYFNANVIRDNTMWAQCGSNLTNGAAIELRGVSTSTCSGNVIEGNLIEMVGYPCGVYMRYSVRTSIKSNNLFDSFASRRVAGVYCDTGAQFNTIEAGFSEDTYPGLLEVPSVAFSNTYRTTAQSVVNLHPNPEHHYAAIRTMRQAGAGAIGVGSRGDQVHTTVLPGVNPYPIACVSSIPATQVVDGATTNGSTTVTSATAAFAAASHLGMPMFGTGIPTNATIVKINSATSVELSLAATATATGLTLSFGTMLGAATNEIGFNRRHIIGQGSAPSGAVHANAGTGGAFAVTGTDTAYKVTITTGSVPVAGQLFNVAPAINFTTAPKVSITPKTAAAATAMQGGYYSTTSTSALVFFLTLAPPASSSLEFDILAIQ
jgi:hypothetical protein